MKDQCYEFINNQIGKPSIVGFGSYGQVKIARNIKSKQVVAIKLIHGKNAKQEIDVHHKLNHLNIIKLLNYYYQKQKNVTYMVLQYAQNGSLNQKIKFGLGKLNKQCVKCFFKDICQAIKYLHQHNYMHRDIKPQNILITKDNTAKLCDFGFAAIFQSRTTICGTFQYMAPQMIKKKQYNYKIDIWALGILLFQMIQGMAPFRGDTGQQVLTEMKKPIKFSPRFDSQQIDLIKKILRVNADNRPEINDILNHPYFQSLKSIKPQKQQQKRKTSKLSFLDDKSRPKAQSPHLVKQKITSSKEQLGLFLKNTQVKKFIKDTTIYTKDKSPFRNSYVKTEPIAQQNFTKQNSFRRNFKDLNNQQSHIRQKSIKKYSFNFFVKQTVGKSRQKSPFQSKIDQKSTKAQQSNLRTFKPLKKLNFYQPLFRNKNCNTSFDFQKNPSFNNPKAEENIFKDKKFKLNFKINEPIKQNSQQQNQSIKRSDPCFGTAQNRQQIKQDINPAIWKLQKKITDSNVSTSINHNIISHNLNHNINHYNSIIIQNFEKNNSVYQKDNQKTYIENKLQSSYQQIQKIQTIYSSRYEYNVSPKFQITQI